MPNATKLKRIRDITLALSYAKLIAEHAEDGEYSPEVNQSLVDVLTRLDARKGGREKGKGPALSPASSANVRTASTARRGVRKPR